MYFLSADDIPVDPVAVQVAQIQQEHNNLQAQIKEMSKSAKIQLICQVFSTIAICTLAYISIRACLKQTERKPVSMYGEGI
jgi:ribosomal protein L11 methylase PrmA